MKDRTPRYPGRVVLKPVAGQANTYDMTRADSPIEAGTPLNKKTLLTDETAYLLELKKDNPTPDDAFAHIASNFVGDSGMNINLLEEAINLKYCKVLTLNETSTAESEYLSDAVWSLGCKHPTQGWTVVAKNTFDAPSQIQFRSKTSTGVVKEFALELGRDFFYSGRNSTAHYFDGMDALTTVANKNNEVCLYLVGHTTTNYMNGSTTQTSYVTWRIWSVFDITTGVKKASSVAYSSGSSYSSYLQNVTRASMWCYYNSTYNYYYGPFLRGVSSTSYGYLAGLPAGRNYTGSTSDSSIATLTSFYYGCMDTNNYSNGAGIFINNTTYLHAEIRAGNYLYLYKGTLSNATTITKTTLASSTTIPTFSSSNWGYSSDFKLHLLKTTSNQLYLYCAGQASSTTAEQYYVLNRYGPFTTSTTSLTDASHYKRIAGWPSGGVNHTSIWPICNISNNPDKLVYCLSATMNTQEVQYFHDSSSTAVYRGITTASNSSSINDTKICGIAGTMRPIMCCDNYFSWVFLASHDRIGSFEVPNTTRIGATNYWTCPEDGRYKIIMVGGGACGGTDYGGGSGYLKIVVKQYFEGDTVAYMVGEGQPTFNSSYPWMYQSDNRSTVFDDEIALCASGAIGGANGCRAEDGGGGGGYNLVCYGGNGQTSSLVPTLNGGQGTVADAVGYGAGGAVGRNGKDGVIVIIR